MAEARGPCGGDDSLQATRLRNVEGLRPVSAAAVASLAEGGTHQAVDLFRGKVEEAEGILMLLDVGRLLARPELVVDQKQIERQTE